MREHYDIQKIIYEIQIHMHDSWNYVSKNIDSLKRNMKCEMI